MEGHLSLAPGQSRPLAQLSKETVLPKTGVQLQLLVVQQPFHSVFLKITWQEKLAELFMQVQGLSCLWTRR